MTQIICDMCGNNITERPYKVAIGKGLGIMREIDCCKKCADAIDRKLITIMNNHWWRGDDPNRRNKRWVSE